MSFPLVSIIIPIYNRAHLIGETLDSVLAQTYENWECIIVDDGSTDNSAEVIGNYVKKDNRFQYHSRPANRLKGGNAARNYGFELSSGKYIKWFDSDDIMFSNLLEKQVIIMQLHKDISFCACQNEYFGAGIMERKKYTKLDVKNHALYSYFIQGNVLLTPDPLWDKQFLIDKDLFDEELSRGQEYDFHFRMLTYNPKYLLHDDFLYTVRRGHDSIESLSNSRKAQLSVLRVYTKAFNITEKINFTQKREVLQYLMYRNLAQMSVLILLEKSILRRFKYWHFYKSVIKFLKLINIVQLCKILTGLTLMFWFGKGYRFMHLKEFDYRHRLKTR